MLLAIDAGNTNIVFAVFDGATLKGAWRAASDTEKTRDEYTVLLSHWLASAGLKTADIKDIIISSVVPNIDFTLKTLCRDMFACEPMIVAYGQVELGLKVLLSRPHEVGADRLADAVAAKHLYGSPLIIIDFGTATTFGVLNEAGDYMGGVIAPGINLSLQALHMAAAKLPSVNVARPEKVIGTNTIEAMQAGVYWGYVGLIEGIVSRMKTEFGKPMKVIATGGLSPLFHPGVKAIDKVDGELTLTGLRLIFEQTKKK